MLTEGWTTQYHIVIQYAITICAKCNVRTSMSSQYVQCVNHNAITMAQTARGQSWPGRTVPTAANLVQTQSLYEDSVCLYSDQNLRSQRPLGQNSKYRRDFLDTFLNFCADFFLQFLPCICGFGWWVFLNHQHPPCGCHYTVMQAEEKLDCRMIAGFQW